MHDQKLLHVNFAYTPVKCWKLSNHVVVRVVLTCSLPTCEAVLVRDLSVSVAIQKVETLSFNFEAGNMI